MRTRRWAMITFSALATRYGSTPEVEQAEDRADRVLGVHRRVDEVAGHRRLHRHRRGLDVADLADEDDVGILPQDRAEDVGERVALLVVDRDLRAALEVVLDRVLDRDRVALLDVDLAKAAVERGRLARAGRAAGEQEARRPWWRCSAASRTSTARGPARAGGSARWTCRARGSRASARASPA